MSIIELGSLPRTPWKNGLGAKATIAAGDGWSLSHAWIETDAPFSDYPGVDRTCVLVRGEGLVLGVAGGDDLDLSAPGAVAAFPGERRVRARLRDGECHVLNAMTSRSLVSHRVAVTQALPAVGYAVVLRGAVRCGGRVAVCGDTVVLPDVGAVASADVLLAAVTFAGSEGSGGAPQGAARGRRS